MSLKTQAKYVQIPAGQQGGSAIGLKNYDRVGCSAGTDLGLVLWVGHTPGLQPGPVANTIDAWSIHADVSRALTLSGQVC
jgi:hypothetical protein